MALRPSPVIPGFNLTLGYT
ncbi:MAG: hypothetical protein QMB92_06605, partial [Thiopseudomonas sp.]